MTLRELIALRINGTATHPWKKTTANRLLIKFRREYGQEPWEKISKALEEVRASKDLAKWASALAPHIELKEAEESEAADAERALKARIIEAKMKKELEKDTAVQKPPVVVNPLGLTIRRRRRGGAHG